MDGKVEGRIRIVLNKKEKITARADSVAQSSTPCRLFIRSRSNMKAHWLCIYLRLTTLLEKKKKVHNMSADYKRLQMFKVHLHLLPSNIKACQVQHKSYTCLTLLQLHSGSQAEQNFGNTSKPLAVDDNARFRIKNRVYKVQNCSQIYLNYTYL